MSQKLKYIGKNTNSEGWRFGDKEYRAIEGEVTANDEHVAPLLLTTAWAQVDPALPIPVSPFTTPPTPARISTTTVTEPATASNSAPNSTGVAKSEDKDRDKDTKKDK